MAVELARLDTVTAVLVPRQSSTDDGSMSLPDQVAAMTAHCARLGWTVGEVLAEPSTSGTLPLAKRKGLKRAVELVEAGEAQIVVCAYFDRLMREPAVKDEVVNRVEARGGRVTSLDFGDVSNKTAMQWYTGTITQANFKLYALQTGEKLAVTKQRNIDDGIPPFPRITPAYERIPDGEQKGRLRPHPENAPLVREAIRMRIEDKASYTTIARWLGDRLVNAEGDPIEATPATVERLFNSKLLKGEIHFGEFTPNLNAIDDPIVDKVTWKRLHAARATRGRYAKSERLLARLGVLRCGTCGSTMAVSAAGPEGRWVYYRCGNRMCERQAAVRAEEAEQVVRDAAMRITAEIQGTASVEVDVELARVEMEAAKAKAARVIRNMAALEDEEEAHAVIAEALAERDEAVAHHERLAARAARSVTVTTLAHWNLMTLDAQRKLIREVVERAVVQPGRGAGRITVSGFDA